MYPQGYSDKKISKVGTPNKDSWRLMETHGDSWRLMETQKNNGQFDSY